jgi:predicted MFS family arabinose efflux permease
LFVGVALQNFLLWVPVEKMFMTEIGFDAAAIGVVAAVYAAVVPLLEVPFGVLADRWSRTGMMIASTVALAASSLVGGLSTNPAIYAVAAVLLGVFFALDSGMADSIVYDTVVEETGCGTAYEKWIGKLHVVEAAALVASALLGGLLAAVTSARTDYFVTVPVLLTAIVALRRCAEPQLHRAAERVSYRRQAGATLRALTAGRAVRSVVLLTALAAATAQVIFEFGPLWLVALHAPAVLYGPYWAALVATVGAGAWLASRLPLDRLAGAGTVGGILVVAAVLPNVSRALPVVIAAQILVALAVAVIGVRAGYLLHDAVSASIRGGVSSGASTLSWLAFLPLSLLFGWVSRSHGVQSAGWLIAVVAAAAAVLLLRTAQRRAQAEPPATADATPCPEEPALALA